MTISAVRSMLRSPLLDSRPRGPALPLVLGFALALALIGGSTANAADATDAASSDGTVSPRSLQASEADPPGEPKSKPESKPETKSESKPETRSPRLPTRWSRGVGADTVGGEYPRPTMVRGEWLSLNGSWEYSIEDAKAPRPERFQGRILVPFPVESALSGVEKPVGDMQALWYRRTFRIPASWKAERILLHFGAVDWECTVWLDGVLLGVHRGGYDSFTFDLGRELEREGDRNRPRDRELVLRVWDPTDAGSQPRGKQILRPQGIWYTPTTGIWQTVWLEPVPTSFIERLVAKPDLEGGKVSFQAKVSGLADGKTPETEHRLEVDVVAVSLRGDIQPVGPFRHSAVLGADLVLPVADLRPWTPETPWLYFYRAELTDEGGQRVDTVSAYFAFRTVSIGPDERGIPRILLNGRPTFLFGPLDQGFWPDGLYAAPSDEALLFDVELTRNLGFNLARKHVKVEPERWYYHCDVLGLAVWQDMPSGAGAAPWPEDGVETSRTAESTAQYLQELEALIAGRGHHPSILAWVPFNEGWGQSGSARAVELVRGLDSTRLVIAASGGNDMGAGDVHDIHVYPGPAAPPAEAGRAAVLGEFGGLGCPMPGHVWSERSWSYATLPTPERLTESYLDLVAKLRPLVASRLSAAVYTQTTDLESEFNGVITYDREVMKLDLERARAANLSLHAAVPGPRAKEGEAAIDRTAEARALAKEGSVAWWRFEDAAMSPSIPPTTPPSTTGPEEKQRRAKPVMIDASGQANHLYSTLRVAFTNETGTPALGGGEPNQGALDLRGPEAQGSVRGLETSGEKRASGPIEGFRFLAWTVEASFRLEALGRFHGIVGKDGRPTESPLAPLQLKVRGDDGRIQIEAIDENGIPREVRSRGPIEAGNWYHAAATSDGRELSLWVDRGDGKGYVLEGKTRFEGALVGSTGKWSVGRGYFDQRPADPARALIDEVRISAVAVEPEAFLHAPSRKAE